MPPPLTDDAVEYADGTPASVQQMASDVTQFLTFAAEPTLEQRKQTGVMVFLFLILFTGIFFAYKRRVWADVKKALSSDGSGQRAALTGRPSCFAAVAAVCGV